MCAGAKDPTALETLVKSMNVKTESVNRDLTAYKGILSKLNSAKELMAELLAREKKKAQERSAFTGADGGVWRIELLLCMMSEHTNLHCSHVAASVIIYSVAGKQTSCHTLLTVNCGLSGSTPYLAARISRRFSPWGNVQGLSMWGACLMPYCFSPMQAS